MYGLPPDFDGQAFVGQILSSITFTVNTIHLLFGSDVVLTVLSTYAYRLAADGVGHTEQVPVTETAVPSLIGRQVTSTNVTEGRNFTLGFDSGAEFSCIDDSDEYESYIIKIYGREIIV